MRLFPRENYLKKIRGFYHDDGIIKVITGVRRCGKSCLMQCIAEDDAAEAVSSVLDMFRQPDPKIAVMKYGQGGRHADLHG